MNSLDSTPFWFLVCNQSCHLMTTNSVVRDLWKIKEDTEAKNILQYECYFLNWAAEHIHKGCILNWAYIFTKVSCQRQNWVPTKCRHQLIVLAHGMITHKSKYKKNTNHIIENRDKYKVWRQSEVHLPLWFIYMIRGQWGKLEKGPVSGSY